MCMLEDQLLHIHEVTCADYRHKNAYITSFSFVQYVCMCNDVRPVSTTIRLLLYYYIKSLPLLLKYCTCIVLVM